MNCPRRHMCWQSKRFYWERAPGPRAVGKGTQEKCSATWLCLRFYGDGVSFWVVFSRSFWLRVLPGGARLVQPRWMPTRKILEVVGHVASPFDPSWTPSVGGGLLVLCSSPGPPVIKQLMQIVTMVPGQGGHVSQCASPNKDIWLGREEIRAMVSNDCICSMIPFSIKNQKNLTCYF